MRSHLNWVIPLAQAEGPDSPFQLAFSAVSLAALGARFHTKPLLLTAIHYYVKALKQINSALEPKLAVGDSILASILLLALFEVSFLNNF
jgi:hypothetical protein